MANTQKIWQVNLAHRPEVDDELRSYANGYGLTRAEVLHRAINCLLECIWEMEKRSTESHSQHSAPSDG